MTTSDMPVIKLKVLKSKVDAFLNLLYNFLLSTSAVPYSSCNFCLLLVNS